MAKSPLQKTHKEEYAEIKERMPEFVRYVENEYHDALMTVIFVWIIATVIFIVTGIWFRKYFLAVGMLYGLIGTYLWAKGSLRKPALIVPLCAARAGFSKPLADEFISSSKETGIAIFLIVLSLIIQAYFTLLLPT